MVATIFPQNSATGTRPSRPEPTAPDASPWLTPAIGPSGAPRTHGDEVRAAVSSATNLTRRHTPAAAARSAPGSPRTADGAPPPPPAGRRRTWRASPHHLACLTTFTTFAPI